MGWADVDFEAGQGQIRAGLGVDQSWIHGLLGVVAVDTTPQASKRLQSVCDTHATIFKTQLRYKTCVCDVCGNLKDF